MTRGLASTVVLRRLACAVALAVLAGAALAAQRGGGGFGGRGGFGGQRGGGGFGQPFRGRLPEGRAVPPRYPPKDFEDGSFLICKLQYTSVTREAMGAGWPTDYPYAGINLMTRLGELTRAPITKNENGEPNYWVVRATDDAMFHCPMLMASDVGTMELSDVEAKRLGAYLTKGGFLWVDDFWGTPGWLRWADQIHKALPGSRIFDIPLTHEIVHQMFQVNEIEQTTNIQNWINTHDTSERGPDSPHADFRGIADDKGRLMVVMTHNTDFGDTWERESESPEFFEKFSKKGYALGVDVLLYALTH
jgi:hypothetical protein